MAREIIDLLSSSPEPASPRKLTQQTQSIPPKPASSRSKAANDDHVYLLSSDNEDTNDHIPPRAPPLSKLTSTRIPRAAIMDLVGGVHIYSDDFDTSVDLDASTNLSQATNGGLLGMNRKQMEEERLMRVKQKQLEETALVEGANSSFSTASTMVAKPQYLPSPRASFNTRIFGRPIESNSPLRKKESETRSISVESDNAMDSGDPFDFEFPPAKKRRISASPPNSHSTSTVTKASGYKRSISNIESSTKFSAPKMKTTGFLRASTTGKALESDPIMFTSSPDFVADAKRKKEAKKRMDIIDEDFDDPFADSPTARSLQRKSPSVDAGELSDDSFPDIDIIHSICPTKPAPKSKSTGQKAAKTAVDKYETEKDRESAAEKKRSEKSQKEKEKLAAKAAKEAEKQLKRLQKEEKAQEKQKAAELAEANKLKTDKKVSVLEMIVELPDSLDPKLASQTRTFLESQTIEKRVYMNPRPIIKWQRKVVAAFNPALGHWENVEPHFEDAKHIMYIMSAREFVDLATGDNGDEVDLHIVQLKSEFESCRIIYLIEGLDNWKRKNRTIKERQYKSAVRKEAGHEDPAPTQRPRKKPEAEFVDENLVEDALVQLQMHQTLIHHTEAMVITAEWILAFTQHISTIPYKTQADSHDTAFCMDAGQIRSGDDPRDTFNKMLQENLRITAPIAYGIMAEYSTIQKLIRGFEENGPLALADCRTSANKDGAFTDRKVGKAISKRLHSVFTGRDPDSWAI